MNGRNERTLEIDIRGVNASELSAIGFDCLLRLCKQVALVWVAGVCFGRVLVEDDLGTCAIHIDTSHVDSPDPWIMLHVPVRSDRKKRCSKLKSVWYCLKRLLILKVHVAQDGVHDEVRLHEVYPTSNFDNSKSSDAQQHDDRKDCAQVCLISRLSIEIHVDSLTEHVNLA